MTHTTETAGRAAPRTAPTHAHDGGPPARPDAKRIAIAIAAAFVVGTLLARWIDWRTHAHPRT